MRADVPETDRERADLAAQYSRIGFRSKRSRAPLTWRHDCYGVRGIARREVSGRCIIRANPPVRATFQPDRSPRSSGPLAPEARRRGVAGASAPRSVLRESIRTFSENCHGALLLVRRAVRSAR